MTEDKIELDGLLSESGARVLKGDVPREVIELMYWMYIRDLSAPVCLLAAYEAGRSAES